MEDWTQAITVGFILCGYAWGNVIGMNTERVRYGIFWYRAGMDE